MRHGPDDFFTDDRVDTRGIDRRLLARLLRVRSFPTGVFSRVRWRRFSAGPPASWRDRT